jgi:N-acetylmuramoyl-L-alanine amidase
LNKYSANLPSFYAIIVASMKHLLLPLGLVLAVTSAWFQHVFLPSLASSGAPPYAIEDLTPPDDPFAWITNWVRPPGPPRVGLQIGHLDNDKLPDELSRLIGNTGASAAGHTEVQVNQRIAELARDLLSVQGVLVDLLPATIPQGYWADTFVAIHADGSTDYRPRGFKLARPRRDFSGGADNLLNSITESYADSTNLPQDPNISRNMTGYYAFAWWRYEHAVHPRTPSVILETGFLTSWADRQIIVNRPELAAHGLAQGILSFLETQNLLTNQN